MLNEYERLELIRQGERANISNEEMDTLQDWAAGVRIECCLLDLLFDGYVELNKFVKTGPSFRVTPKGQNFINETEVEIDSIFKMEEELPEDFDYEDLEMKELYVVILKALLTVKKE